MSELQNIEPVEVTSPLTPLEMRIVAVSPASPKDEVLTMLDRLKFFSQEISRLKKLMDQQAIAWIQENGDIQISDTARYYIGHPKDTECTDPSAALEAYLEAVGGDWKLMCEVLASGAIKHGAAKKRLSAEVYAKFFKVTVKDKLETGAAAPKQLQKFDEKFIK